MSDENERLTKLNEDKFRTIQAYCGAASEDKATIRELLESLRGITRIVEAMRFSTGLGKGQLERLEKAKALIAKVDEAK